MRDGPGLPLALELPGVALGLEQERRRLLRPLRHRHRGPRPQLEHLDPDQLDAEEQRPGILGPDRAQADPRPGDVAAVEVEVDQRLERGRVLEVERPPVPRGQERLELGLRLGPLIPGQLDDRHVERGEVRGRVEVAAFLGLAVQDGPAPPELGDFAHLDQGPEREVVHGVALPGDARAMVAEELLGLVERGLRRPSTGRTGAS